MKNTTKLKYILQIYTVLLDMDDEGNFVFTLRHKRTGSSETYTDKSYSTVIAKGFGFMKREMKLRGE
jgi:hypothetical protein